MAGEYVYGGVEGKVRIGRLQIRLTATPKSIALISTPFLISFTHS